MGAAGIGDGLLGLQATAAVRTTRGPVRYLVGQPALPFVALFDGYDELGLAPPACPPGALDLNAGYEAENAARAAVPRAVRYARNAGADAPVPFPPPRAPEALAAAGAGAAGAVALIPYASALDRRAPARLWADLVRLLIGVGLEPVVLAGPGDRTAGFGCPVVANASPERVAGVLCGVRCAVGVDTGLTHLAAALYRPTVVLTGPTTGAGVFGSYPTAVPLPGPLPCSGCYWNPPYSGSACGSGCPALAALTAERVLEVVQSVADVDRGGLPMGGGSGVVYVGCDRWARVALGCRLTRELGCRWPVQAWYRAGDPVDRAFAERHDVDLIDVGATCARFGIALPPDRTRDAGLAARYTPLDRAVVLDADVYPCRMPCRLDGFLRAHPCAHWVDGPLAVDRTRSAPGPDGVVTGGVTLGTGTPHTGATVYAVDGRPTFVRCPGSPDPGLPLAPRVRELLG
jgi:hypothetical protein